MLFNTASPLTDAMRAIAKERGIPTTAGSRAFVLNADMVALVQAIEIGTRPSNVAMDEPVVSPAGGLLNDEEAAAAAAQEMARASKGAGASAATAAPTASGKTTVRLSIMDTGKIVEATIELDKKGRIVGVMPALPIDPNVEYRLGPAK
jgi:hypothetical protein